ncbi:MAG: type II secretion system protein [Verrucomicrobiota bacterium]|jgi:prepilin-type N-terminal cleavage/methylation domain-containing protein
MKIKTSRRAGFTLIEVMIVGAVIGLLAAIAISNFVRARATSQMNICINNLRQIDSAKQQWALQNNKAATDLPEAADIAPFFGHGSGGSLTSVYCPLDPAQTFATSYTINVCNVAPTCNIQGAGHGDSNYPHALRN